MFVFKITDKTDGRRALERLPSQACDTCKQRKLKCDRLEPCGACQTSSTTCSYEKAPRRRGRPPAARRLRSDKQRLRSTPLLETSSPASSISTTPQAWSTSSGFGQTGEVTLPASSGALDTTAFLSTGLSCSPYSIQGSPTHDGCGIGQLGSPGTESCPAEEWQDVAASAPDSNHDAHSASSQLTAPVNIPQHVATQHPLSAYTHWTRVFIMRLYPVFPVVDPGYLLSKLSVTRDVLPRSVARFFAAMSAAVIVQLNLDAGNMAGHDSASLASSSMGPPNQLEAPFSLADRYIAECIAERQSALFIDEADEWTILESFFMFSYYGNRNKSKQAWYYLREAMGFAISQGLDREESYNDPDLEVNERRRRLYWLLFVTERAYGLQHRTSTTLQASIGLPQIYDGCDEATLTGFISLIRLFVCVDTTFVASWCSRSIKGNGQTILRLLDPESFSAVSNLTAVDETQRVDISATQCWLHTLAWRLHDHTTSTHGQGESGAAAIPLRKAARNLLFCFSDTRRNAIESHGIGMEQKVSDIAGFMCDLLPTLEQSHLTADTDSIPNLLHNFMCFLANFRNQESSYLGPLAERATALLMIHGGGPSAYEPCLDSIEAEAQDICRSEGHIEETWEDEIAVDFCEQTLAI